MEKVKKNIVKKPVVKKEKTEEKEVYIESVGRRKTSQVRVRLVQLEKQATLRDVFLINKKPYSEYFPTLELQTIIMSPLKLTGSLSKFKVSAKAVGGGVRSQAEALRHGIARALVKFDDSLRTQLKTAKFLTRDPRMKERKKFGLKKARRRPQWSKR